MRLIILSLAVGWGPMTLAIEPGCDAGLGNFRTQDNVNYAAIFKAGLSKEERESCLERITALARGRGNGQVEHLKLIDVVLVNLTTAAARDVGALDCVQAIEVDRPSRI